MKTNDVKNKVIIITGGTGGIGAAICQLLKNQGAIIVSASRGINPTQSLNRKTNEIGNESLWIQADLNSFKSWNDLINSVQRKFHRIDILINCVGMLIPGSFESLTEHEIEYVTQTNILSIMYGVKAVLPLMRKQKYGHIINIGSLGGMIPMPYEATYSATKFAVRGFSLSLSKELQETGISVSLISPGPVRTKMLELEATDERSTIAFVNKPLEPVQVAKAIINLINHPTVEVVLPKLTGKLTAIACHTPKLFSAVFPILDFIGGKRLRKFRNKS